MRYLATLIIVAIFISSCQEEMQPKPNAFLALEYNEANYKTLEIDCPYSFDVNLQANVKASRVEKDCWIDIEYPNLNGTLFITYQEVNGNLEKLLSDAQKLPLQHTKKADGIEGDEYTNSQQKAYGMLYEVSGNAASQAQFYLTDSTNHFLTGSIYFKAQPNYDSIYPSSVYLKKDLRRLMESLEWSKN